jgi:hypothetical protein
MNITNCVQTTVLKSAITKYFDRVKDLKVSMADTFNKVNVDV